MSKDQITAYLNFEEVESAGMSQVCFVRQRPNGLCDLYGFLVDSKCLGVKNALMNSGMMEHEIREFLNDSSHGDHTIVPAAQAKAFVEGSVSYAKKLGLLPHKDYRKARRILSRIKEDWDEDFTYGDPETGKPMYISGPNDTPQFINRVMRAIGQSQGEDGF